MRTSTSTAIGKAILPIALAGALAGPAVAAGFQLDAAALEKINTEAQRLIDEHRTPGLAIGIMSEGKVIYAKGFGQANLETDTKVMPDSVFKIGSMTKQFTAASIMLLEERGKLDIDDPLSKFFPDFPRGTEVTLRQLLTHTSGIHPVMVPGAPPTPEQRVKIRSAADFVLVIQGQTTLYDFEPGTSYRYSNSGYVLLGVIVEKVSGVSLAEFFKQNLFDPAGMTASALDKATEVVPNRASGYNRQPDSNAFTNAPQMMDVGTGGGGIRSTVGDMLRWQDALLAGRIISPDSVKAMTTPGVLKDGQPLRGPPIGPPGGSRYGFGVSVGDENGHAFITHGGGGPGFRSIIKMFPNDHVAFVVLTNSGAPQIRRPANRRRRPPDRDSGAADRAADSPRRRPDPSNPVRELDRVLTDLIVGRQ